TNHYDVIENDEILTLIFKPRKSQQSGEIGLNLQGTGVIADQYGREPEGIYLTIPKLYIQGNGNTPELELTGYPNPFSEKVTLSYRLPEAGKVKLEVYNAMGMQVKELVNQYQDAGKYTVEFQGSKLSAGMYTFKLNFEGKQKSQIVVLKMLR
ncbi:MAG: T9SS type A sorting domain-containing protein, partial [Bacteroidales bacterium]|nr:T9SS type A sorting domain-containing protein [Bacteroidales bacterium]